MVWLLSCCLKLALAANPQTNVQFKKGKIEINGQFITVELAESPEQQAYGLMNRQHLNANDGMLFIFFDEETRSFWMKNTFIDLSIGYFDKNKKLIDIQDMAATSVLTKNYETYPSKKPAMYALEMNKGWFKRHNIRLGQKFRFISPAKH